MIIFQKRGRFVSPKENFRVAYQCVRRFGVHKRRNGLARFFKPTALEKLEWALGKEVWAAAVSAKTARDFYDRPVLPGHFLALQSDRRQATQDEELYWATTDERLKGRLLQSQLHRLLHPRSRYAHPLAY